MATPTIGNVTNANPTPGSNSYSLTHNQNSGSNKLLVVMVTMSNQNGRTFTGAKYNNVPMTELYQQNRTGLSQRMVFYYLENPNDGNNTLQIRFNGSQFNPISVHARSFTDSGGIGASIRTGGLPTPHNGTLTVDDDSLIMLTSCSINAILTQQIPAGSSVVFTSHNTNRQVATGAISSVPSSGTINLRATSTSGSLTLDRTEIKGLSNSDDDFMMFF
mgnify:CR=1 FL=1|tara:strand:- start:2207 stop:2860 length:654 start_codon:yes stop_codon:yes gene_type:complete